MRFFVASLFILSPLLVQADHLGTLSFDRTAPLTASQKPQDFQDIGITEKLGQSVDLTLPVIDENGTTTTLGKYFDGTHPVSLSLVYYSCPGLCSLHLNGVFTALKEMDWTPGKQFQLVVLSFEPKDTAELALAKKKNYLRDYYQNLSAAGTTKNLSGSDSSPAAPSGAGLSQGAHAGAENGVHFLTATPETIAKLTQQVGFKYKWNDQSKDWSHASAAIVITPDGKISRYLHGIDFEPATYKLALSEASNGKIGNLVDKMIWYCFRYDPHQSKYVLYAFRAMQIGAVLMMILLAFLILPTWMKGRKSQ